MTSKNKIVNLLNSMSYLRAIISGERNFDNQHLLTRIGNDFETDYPHIIQFQFDPKLITVDIDFFNSVNFHVILEPEKPIPLMTIEGREFDGWGLFMDFQPDNPDNKKGFAVRFKDEDNFVTYSSSVL